MFISKKRFKELEKRIADLERQVQGQQKEILQNLNCKIDFKTLKDAVQNKKISTFSM